MTTRDDVETRLLRAVAVDPSADALHWLDQRVAQVAARPIAIPRHGLRTARIFLRPLALVAAFLLLAGAVVAGVGLLERLAATAPGWRVAWDRAEVLGLSQTDSGYTITLERAYGDINQAMVFLTLEGLPAPRSDEGVQTDHFTVYRAELRDPAGNSFVSNTAVADVEPGLAAYASSFEFDPPPSVAGTYVLTIDSIGFGASGPDCVSPCVDDRIAGSWQFEFALPKPAGTVVSTDVSDTVGEVTLHLTELRISSTMIKAKIGMRVGDAPVAYWNQPAPSIQHGSASYVAGGNRALLDADTGTLEFQTYAGTDDAAGTWKIIISDLIYGMTDDEATQLTGPWTLTVAVR